MIQELNNEGLRCQECKKSLTLNKKGSDHEYISD